MAFKSSIEERYSEMMSPNGGETFFRDAHFLKPSFPQTLWSPAAPVFVASKPISPILKILVSKIRFHGWRNPLKNWGSWVEKMRVLHEPTWRKAGIFESIMASKLEIPKSHGSLFLLAEKWCPETSSFVLPWGEATVTLEDVLVLGGFSVTGDSVLAEIPSKQLLGIEENLHRKRLEICRTKSKKASQHLWMEMWMDKGSENEHEAFLSLWLSRYVLPADDLSTVNKSVLPVAVLLATGTKIALAPAVLASIYRDLRLLKEKIETLREIGQENYKNVASLKLWAPLQLFQAWIWERFPKSSPKPNPITTGFRLERWSKVKISKKDEFTFESTGSNFCWRPYSKTLDNWSFCANLYPEECDWLPVSFHVGFDIESYARCVRTSALVGLELDCIEQYLPHRVSMQFGLDQDIPFILPHHSDNNKAAWNDYNRPIIDATLYVPSKLNESHVTEFYFLWWGQSKAKKETLSSPTITNDVNPSSSHFQGTLNASRPLAEMLRIKVETNEADIPPGYDLERKREALNELCYRPSSKRSKGSLCQVSSGIKIGKADPSSHSSPQVKGMQADNDSDDDRTLNQIYGLNFSKGANRRSTLPQFDFGSPPPSSGDSESLQEVRNNAGETMAIECTRVGVPTNGSTSDAGSPIRTPMSTINMEGGAKIRSHQSSKIDLVDRARWMQRIVDMAKVAKSG